MVNRMKPETIIYLRYRPNYKLFIPSVTILLKISYSKKISK